jgi:hypothetical protein
MIMFIMFKQINVKGLNLSLFDSNNLPYNIRQIIKNLIKSYCIYLLVKILLKWNIKESFLNIIALTILTLGFREEKDPVE